MQQPSKQGITQNTKNSITCTLLFLLYSKAEKGELIVSDVVKDGDIILAKSVSVIDWIFLEMAYSPVFTTMCLNPGVKYDISLTGG